MEEIVKESKVKVFDLHVDAIIPNPTNVNEMDDETLVRLSEEIRDTGFLDPIDVVPCVGEDKKYIILGGEHRLKAAKMAGLTYIPSIIRTEEKWNDRDLFDLVAFRLNVLKGSQNPEKFVHLYDRMAQKYGHESLKDIFAVTDKSLWKKVTKNIKKDMKQAGMSDDVIAQLNEAEKKSKTFDQFTKYLNKILQSQVLSAKTNAIIFVNKDKENILIEASDLLFSLVKKLHEKATNEQKTLSEVLEPAMVKLLSENSGP